MVACTYLMTVQNVGPDSASGITATLGLPAGVTLISATSSSGVVTTSSGGVVATLEELDLNASATITVVAEATSVGSPTATATVSSQSQDPNSANNTASVTTVVSPAADLAVSISDSASKVAPTIAFSYTISLVNNGPQPIRTLSSRIRFRRD